MTTLPKNDTCLISLEIIVALSGLIVFVESFVVRTSSFSFTLGRFCKLFATAVLIGTSVGPVAVF